MLFHSVQDSLFNNQPDSKPGSKQTKSELALLPESDRGVSKEEYDRFLIELTITYEFDYI